ncbi:unnamed protein product [Diatraea saccharalis]|uniref:HAT C-terminal dimerisation domain-containing protein n=1 Tax=Diatraea saccharalis TaxID=40085 RepID=A0A9N9QXC9_9NEOP|nr:unnamed protein product [Diatraea saccharalis]
MVNALGFKNDNNNATNEDLESGSSRSRSAADFPTTSTSQSTTDLSVFQIDESIEFDAYLYNINTNMGDNAQACAKALNVISELLKSNSSTNSTSFTAFNNQSQETTSAKEKNNMRKFNKSNKELVSQSCQCEPREGMDDILKQYMREPLKERKENPVIYWAARKNIWPDLSDLALRYLSVVATSVPSERLLSLAGSTLSETRNR